MITLGRGTYHVGVRNPSIARVLILVACTTMVVAGCNGDDSSESGDGSADDAASASESTSTPPPPPPPPPKKNRCYDLGKRQLASASSDAAAVACKSGHTTQTYLVGTLAKKLTRGDSVNPNAVADTVTRRCDEAFGEHVGGDDQTRTLARVYPVWFVPTEDEMRRGARWFRCDVTATKGGGAAARLPDTSRGMLDADDALNRWGTCAPADASRPEAKATLCSQPHGLRAIDVVNLGSNDTSWPGGDALESQGSKCETAVREYLDNPTGALSFRWTYPTKQQWKDGRRYGLCWSKAGS